jgi:dihydrofolate reductase
MSKVFFSVTMSVDGFIAPEGRIEDPDNGPWLAQWSELQKYLFQQKFFRDNLKLGEGGETGEDNRIFQETFERTGVTILGKRMFDGGERYWPEDAPFHTPVFVVTHQVRSPWERPGGTTFYFVNDGIESALRRAREAAGGRDIRIGGGADTIQQFLNAGLVDEFHLAVSPMFMGKGARLFVDTDHHSLGLELQGVVSASPLVTHLRYTVRRK